MDKIKDIIKRMSSWLSYQKDKIKDTITGPVKRKTLRLIPMIVYFLLLIGLPLYIALAFFGKTEPPGLELAIVSAVIGGLLFSGGFPGIDSRNVKLAKKIRMVGLLYLVATIAFIFLALYLPLTQLKVEEIWVNWFVVIVFSISLLSYVITFAWATAALASILSEVWSDSEK